MSSSIHIKLPVIFGEIIEACATHFTAICPFERLHEPPIFGSLVKVSPIRERLHNEIDNIAGIQETDRIFDPFDETIRAERNDIPTEAYEGTLYALVYAASTGSIEPGRRPSAYGLTEAELRLEQPQIFELLATEFSAMHAGFIQDGKFRSYLPPRPARLHAQVTECSREEARMLTNSTDLLRSLLTAALINNADELIAAFLRCGWECRERDFMYLVRMGKSLASLLRDNPERLTALLRKLEP